MRSLATMMFGGFRFKSCPMGSRMSRLMFRVPSVSPPSHARNGLDLRV